MTTSTGQPLAAQRILVTGGAGTIGSHVVDLLVRRRRRRGRRARQLRPRPAENLADAALPSGDRCASSRATSATPALVRDGRPRASTSCSTWPRIRITQCAEEPRLAQRGARRRHVQRARGGRGGRRREGRRLLVGVGLRPGRDVPDHRAPPPVQQRHLLRRGQGVQRGHAAQLPRHVRPGLRGAALLQRLRPADGHPRALHRGADPLDGAHRRAASRR